MVSYNDLKKNLKKDFSGFKNVRLALLSDSASQLLKNAIRAYGYERRINFEIYEADYNQINGQVFDAGSELYAFMPQFVFINKSTEKLLNEFYKCGSKSQSGFSDKISKEFHNLVETISKRLKTKVIINTYPEINDAVFGNFATKLSSSFLYQLRKTNLLLMDLAQNVPDLFIADLAALQSCLGYRFVFDAKMYVSADMVYSLDFLPFIAKGIADIVECISGSFKKCVVLDLDNTLWGGIIGDDGMEGIQIGYYGSGKIFTELQSWIKQLKNRGIILAVCSKNTDEIAREPFLKHPDMVLRLEDIAIFVANWETKVDNIRYIQSILNIGFDSMVFLDDNPFEREMVKSGIPELTVPELPEDAADYLNYLRMLNLFETVSFTEEDILRTRQYQEEANRKVQELSFENEEEFLASLQMTSEVKPFDNFTIPRVAQLSQRSNQFNLRTVRYTEEDLKRIVADIDFYTISFTLADRFGDHGLICAVILRKEDDETLFIDTWIMSCRVLKRGMEHFTLNMIIDLANKHNFKYLIGEYLPTKKNEIVKDHYKNLGFIQSGELWKFDIEKNEKTNVTITNNNKTWTAQQS